MNAVFRVVTRIQDQDDFSGSLTDGQFLKWNSSTNNFELQSVSISAGGSSGQLQYNNSGAFAGVNHSSIGITGDIFKLSSLAVSNIPFIVKGFTGQTANLTEWRNSSNSVLASVSPSGVLSITPAISAGTIDIGLRYGASGFFTGMQLANGAPRFHFFASRSNNPLLAAYSFVNSFGLTPTNNVDADVIFSRVTAATLTTLSDSGVVIRNLANSANAALTCGAITTSGLLTCGSIGSPANVIAIPDNGAYNYISGEASGGFSFKRASNIAFWCNTATGALISVSGGTFGFSPSTTNPVGGGTDIAIGRDSSNVLGIYTSSSKSVKAALTCAAITASGNVTLQNSTTSVLLTTEKTFTSSTNREYLSLGYNSTSTYYELVSKVGSAGGSNQPIRLGHYAADGTTFSGMNIDTNGTLQLSCPRGTSQLKFYDQTAGVNATFTITTPTGSAPDLTLSCGRFVLGNSRLRFNSCEQYEGNFVGGNSNYLFSSVTQWQFRMSVTNANLLTMTYNASTILLCPSTTTGVVIRSQASQSQAPFEVQNSSNSPLISVSATGATTISGSLTIGAYTLPNTDGTSGQVLSTNGSGTLAWSTISGGGGSGITSINGDSTVTQLLTVGTSGTDFTIDSTTTSGTTVFNLPDASATARGLITTGTQTFAGNKIFIGSIQATQFAVSNGYFSVDGDCQSISKVIRNKTTSATATELFLDGSSTRLTITSGTIMFADIIIVGIKSDGSSSATYRRKVAIKNVGGSTSLVGSVESIGTDYESSATNVSLTADDTNDSLKVLVTGIASETWRWSASVQGIQIAYGT